MLYQGTLYHWDIFVYSFGGLRGIAGSSASYAHIRKEARLQVYRLYPAIREKAYTMCDTFL